MTIEPTGLAPVSARSGLRIAIPPFIALAASRTSGTKRMPSLKSIPTIVIPATSASLRTFSADQPLSRSMFVPSSISSLRPSYKSSCICSTSSSSDKSASTISSSYSSLESLIHLSLLLNCNNFNAVILN